MGSAAASDPRAPGGPGPGGPGSGGSRPPGVAVRRAVPADAEVIGRIHVDAWRWAYAGVVDTGVLATLDPVARAGLWRERLTARRPPGVVVVAERDGDVVGFAMHGRSRDDDAGGAGELYAIYLAPGVVGTGAGSVLMRRSLDDLTAASYLEATLWVLAANDRGRAFYERWGWRQDGATKDEPNGDGPPLVELRYRRPLP